MELADRSFHEPSAARLSPTADLRDDILASHDDALLHDQDGYDDPVTGLFVFTAAYLATRDCCDLGCRHCPYCE